MVENSIPERYEKNPMLAVVENYVLEAIGRLESQKAELLNAMICRTFGGTDWKATLRRHFDWPAETDENLRAMWKRRQGEAEAKQEDLTAEGFAREAADDMFAGLGGGS